MAKTYSWYVCPTCRSRMAVERGHAGEIRCGNCSTVIRPAKANLTAAAKRADAAHPQETLDDEYHLAPTDKEPLAKPTPSLGHEPPPSNSQLEHLRVRREQLAARGLETPPAPSALPSEKIEFRDDERYPPAAPPRWTFFSGVWNYPWRPQSILPWTVLSIGIVLCGVVGLLVIGGLQSNSREGAVMAGFLCLAMVWLSILTSSYAAACLFAVTETTAYNYDAPYDWPEPDWRDRFVHMLWVGWCLGLTAALVVGLATLVSESVQERMIIAGIGIGLLFPIVVLSTLETNSLLPLSAPVVKSLATEAIAWVTFYVLTAALLGACTWATVVLLWRMGMLSPLISGPLWAACILIYARLIGRLAWRIMRPGETQLQAWRKAHQSTLAGEVRRPKEGEEDISAD